MKSHLETTPSLHLIPLPGIILFFFLSVIIVVLISHSLAYFVFSLSSHYITHTDTCFHLHIVSLLVSALLLLPLSFRMPVFIPLFYYTCCANSLLFHRYTSIIYCNP